MVYYTNCFCCKSKTGAKILAIFGIVYNSLYIIFIGSIFYVVYDKLPNEETFRSYINAFFGVYIVIILTWISFCAVLLHGINKKKKDFLKPWLIFDMIGLAVSKICKNIYIHNIFSFSFIVVHNCICSKCYYENQRCGLCKNQSAMVT